MSDRHIPYRQITCRFDDMAVWTALAKDKAIGRSIRKLSIAREYPLDYYTKKVELTSIPDEMELVKKAAATATEEEIEAILLSAISNMPHLEELNWDRQPPLDDKLWIELAKLPIRRLKIRDAIDKDYDAEDEDEDEDEEDNEMENIAKEQARIHSLFTSTLFNSFSNLLELNYTTYDGKPDIERLTQFLKTNSQMESLTLNFVNARPALNIGPLMFKLSFANLKSITLANVHCSGHEAVTFLSAHPLIEQMSLPDSFRASATEEWDLPAGTLKALSNLSAENAIIKNILPCARNVESIIGLKLSNDNDKNIIFPLLEGLPLKKISMSSFIAQSDRVLRDLAIVAPKLTQLWFHSTTTPTPNGPLAQNQDMKPYLDCLTSFQNLAVLRGIRFVSGDIDEKQTQEDLKYLLGIVPSLRMVDSADEAYDGPPRLVEITKTSTDEFKYEYKAYEDFEW